MDDRTLVEAFEATTLSGDDFPHAAHVRVGWYYLQHFSVLEAMARFKTALQRFATAKGKPDRYHETITIAYLVLIAERLAGDRRLSWEEFAARHPDLLRWKPSILTRYYNDDALASPRARAIFVTPDLVPADDVASRA